MKKIYYTLIIYSFFSCSGTQKIYEKRGIEDKECIEVIERLRKKMRPLNDGRYEFRFDSTSKNGVEEEAETWMNLINRTLGLEHKTCIKKLYLEDIVLLIGKPSLVFYDGSYHYTLNFGIECPCKGCPSNRRFSNCSYVFFKAEEGKLVSNCFQP